MQLFVEGKQCKDCKHFDNNLKKKCTARKKETNALQIACFLINKTENELNAMKGRLKR